MERSGLLGTLAELLDSTSGGDLLLKQSIKIFDVFWEKNFCLLIFADRRWGRIAGDHPLYFLVVYRLDLEEVDNTQTPAVADQLWENLRV